MFEFPFIRETRSFHLLDVGQLPRPIEERLLRAVETEEDFELFADLVGTQFDSFPAGAVGPK
jgi:hypothetical protein